MKVSELASIILISSLVLVQLFVPAGIINNETLSALELNLNFGNFHWSFFYFTFTISLILLGLFFFIVTFRKAYSKYRVYIVFIWLATLAVVVVFGIAQQSYLEMKELYIPGLKSSLNMMLSLFLLSFLIIATLVPYIVKKENKVPEPKIFPHATGLWNYLYLTLILVGLSFGSLITGTAFGRFLGAIVMYGVSYLIEKYVAKSRFSSLKKTFYVFLLMLLGVTIMFSSRYFLY